MSTVRELINGSLRLLGVVAQGETPSAEEISDGLSALNGMMSGWSTNNLIIYAQVREKFSLVAEQSSYTLGSGGNFNTTRPVEIMVATIEVQDSTPYELPVEIINADQWAAISDKALTNDIPTKLFRAGTYPLDTLYPWPVPSATNKLVLYSLKPVSSFASANDAVSLPEGYERALRFNLAVEIAPEYGRDPSVLVLNTAAESKADIKRRNKRDHYMRCDAAVVGGSVFDIRTGE